MNNEFASRRHWGPTPKYDLVRAYEPPSSEFVTISGPCSVESVEQIFDLASFVAKQGATHLRGGVFRAGTYPGKNFGLISEHLLEAYQAAAHQYGLLNIMEVLDYSPSNMMLFNKYADCFQIGCRQMQNYSLLRKVSQYGKPIFLKRHPGSTIDEWLGSAEHILSSAPNNKAELYLIERGSSGHANHVRWDLSISIIPAIAALSKIPVIVDGSHGTGRRDLVDPMTLAGVAAGAKGVLIEVHNDPENSLSDPDQALSKDQYKFLMWKLNALKTMMGYWNTQQSKG